jgi:RES domain-containing protein
MPPLPSVHRTTGFFNDVEGTFYRAVDARFRAEALAGSRLAGRYSSPDQPTLYLSATPEGVAAAMIAHGAARAANPELVAVAVKATRIFDLRDTEARRAAELRLEDATAPWQARVAAGEKPSSWLVRDKIEASGGAGLIDPSRKVPGLWHLVLFAWNVPGAPRVTIVE